VDDEVEPFLLRLNYVAVSSAKIASDKSLNQWLVDVLSKWLVNIIFLNFSRS